MVTLIGFRGAPASTVGELPNESERRDLCRRSESRGAGDHFIARAGPCGEDPQEAAPCVRRILGFQRSD
ncbi:unnamed protein product [Lota lota]